MMWMDALAGFLALLCAVLWLRHVRVKKDVAKTIQAAKGIRAGNWNMRCRLGTTRKDMLELGGEMNRLADFFQASIERTQLLEEDRKRMISNISHDLRTPLTSLLGYIEALRQDESLTEKERAAFLGIASEKGAALLKRMQAFFDLSRLEETEDVELQKVDVAELARTVLLDFYPEFTESGITPTASIPESPMYVQGNADCLRRILNNLISNALRYGGDGKEIGIAVRKDAKKGFVDVWDHGKGISPENLPHIFERLYTAEASRNAALRGTGLGLTIAKNLIQKQGGNITVESIPNEKTIFSFWLPLA
jgi:signal transduction histidine kinase